MALAHHRTPGGLTTTVDDSHEMHVETNQPEPRFVIPRATPAKSPAAHTPKSGRQPTLLRVALRPPP